MYSKIKSSSVTMNRKIKSSSVTMNSKIKSSSVTMNSKIKSVRLYIKTAFKIKSAVVIITITMITQATYRSK